MPSPLQDPVDLGVVHRALVTKLRHHGDVLLASPVLGLRVGNADASSDPAGSPTRAHHDLMANAFGDGFDASLLLVASTPDAASAQAFATLVHRLDSLPGVAHVATAPAGRDVASATVTPTTTAQAEQTADLVTTLRENVIPAAEAGTGLQVYVGGQTATSIDVADALMSKLPLYLGLIALLGFLLLALTAGAAVLLTRMTIRRHDAQPLAGARPR